MRRLLLISAALYLTTGFVAPAFCQNEWIEFTNDNAAPLFNNAPQSCDSAWGRQYHVWGNGGQWMVATSAHPAPVPTAANVHVMSDYQPGGGYLTCPSGWWDWLAISGPGISIACDDDVFANGPHAGLPLYLDDAYTSDSHWEPMRPVEVNGPEPLPDGVYEFYMEPNRLALSGSIGGVPAWSLGSADVVRTVRTGNAVRVYIGPDFAAADFNRDGAVNGTDIFAFISAWFRQDGRAGECDGVGGCTVPDVFAFLSAFFRGE